MGGTSDNPKPKRKPAGGLTARLRRDTTPLNHKAAWLVVVSLAAGLCIGVLEGALGYRLWTLPVFALLALAVLVPLAQTWLGAALHGLIRLLPSTLRDEGRRPLTALPTSRGDEVGRLATLFAEAAAVKVRHHHHARALRRTMDTRVADATRRATAELKRQAFRDPLTGAGNRRFLDHQLPALVDAAFASTSELVCLAVDMDHFKQVNDTLGHDTGDQLLTLTTDLLTGSVRTDDLVLRTGGDEFLVLLPGGNLQRADELAGRIRRLFLQQTRTHADRLPEENRPNLSIGIAALLADNLKTGPALLKKADQRLYTAKRAGKGKTATPQGLSDAA